MKARNEWLACKADHKNAEPLKYLTMELNLSEKEHEDREERGVTDAEYEEELVIAAEVIGKCDEKAFEAD